MPASLRQRGFTLLEVLVAFVVAAAAVTASSLVFVMSRLPNPRHDDTDEGRSVAARLLRSTPPIPLEVMFYRRIRTSE